MNLSFDSVLSKHRSPLIAVDYRGLQFAWKGINPIQENRISGAAEYIRRKLILQISSAKLNWSCVEMNIFNNTIVNK